MHPRMYMQTIQFVTYNQYTERFTFETRHVSGRRHHFVLSKNQFLALDDVIAFIQKSKRYGHYPLGQNMWINYNADDVRLYKETHECKHINFNFECFEDYKRHTHARLHSFIRPNCEVTRRRRKRHGEDSVMHYQRPLPVTLQSSHQPSTSKQRCRNEREVISRSTDNVIMSHDDEARSLLSKRKHTNPWRRSDSISSTTSTCAHLSSPPSVRLDSSDDEMESE